MSVRATSWFLLCAATVSSAGACETTAVGRYRHALTEATRSHPIRLDEDPFPGASVLDRRVFVDAVLARNPDIEAARAGWRRALHRVPQEAAFDDPMVSYSIAPLSIAGEAPFGQRVQIEQKLPIPGRCWRSPETAGIWTGTITSTSIGVTPSAG